MSTRLEVRSVHESTTFSNQLHHYGAFLDFPTRKHAIALTLILVCFRSIQFKLSNNQAKLSKQSITADAAIRIVLLTLQGCTATHTCHQLPPFVCHCSRGDSDDATTTLRPQLRSSPESRLSEGDSYGSPAEVPVQPQTMCAGSQAGLEKPFIHFADRATALPELQTAASHGVRTGSGTRMRGVSEPNVWLYSSSWITTQELGLKAVFNETTHCVLLHSPSSFTLY